MKINRKLISILLLLNINLACSNGLETSAANDIQIPLDQSTSEERKAININLSLIQNLAYENGYKDKFNKIPIIVSDENPDISHWWGLCVKDQNKTSQFILINRIVFEHEKQTPWLHYIFGVLLHEIGHCYFNRGHDKNVLSKPGFLISVRPDNSSFGTSIESNNYPTSIMYANNDNSSEFIGVPKQFENNFVRELLGLNCFRSAKDLENINGVSFVKPN